MNEIALVIEVTLKANKTIIIYNRHHSLVIIEKINGQARVEPRTVKALEPKIILSQLQKFKGLVSVHNRHSTHPLLSPYLG